MIGSSHHGPLPLHKPEIGRRSWKKRSRIRTRCAYGDGSRATTGDSAGGRPTQSSLDEQQCACKASSACGSEGGSSPVPLSVPLLWSEGEVLTSSSDQDRFPPADILRARRLEAFADWESISTRGERIWGWWCIMLLGCAVG
jgi:hypothetical protein